MKDGIERLNFLIYCNCLLHCSCGVVVVGVGVDSTKQPLLPSCMHGVSFIIVELMLTPFDTTGTVKKQIRRQHHLTGETQENSYQKSTFLATIWHISQLLMKICLK